MTQIININLQQIKEISLLGIRRTAVFMGLGVNAAREEGLTNYQLQGLSSFRFLPDNLASGKISEFKQNFEQWIICCGLRELTETFAIYLSEIYKVSLMAEIYANKKVVEEPEKLIKTFKWKGIEEQLKRLGNQFGIKTTKENYLITVNRIRNCLTHRRGIVGYEDLIVNESALQLCWWAFNSFIKTPSGEEIPFMPPFPKEGVYLKDGGDFCLRFLEKKRVFKLGEVISLTPNELSEICYLFIEGTNEIASSTFEFFKDSNVEIIETEQVASHGPGK